MMISFLERGNGRGGEKESSVKGASNLKKLIKKRLEASPSLLFHIQNSAWLFRQNRPLPPRLF